MLSLSPRFDLFRFLLPKDILPPEVESKYRGLINREPGVLISPIDYLNESIKGITIPGFESVHIEQKQIGSHAGGIEPHHSNYYIGSSNPLDLIEREIKITFRLNQGLYNYFMLYETLFYRIDKSEQYVGGNDFYIDILDEQGRKASRIVLMQCSMDAIQGLDFSYDKVERQQDTFEVVFKYNNIDFDFYV